MKEETESLDLGKFEEHKLNVLPGWWQLLEDLHVSLCSFWPEYRVGQVKEKWGGLRVYLDYHDYETGEPLIADQVIADRVEKLLDRVERQSYRICENCGDRQTAAPRNTGWIKTLCYDCADGASVHRMWYQRVGPITFRGHGEAPEGYVQAGEDDEPA